MRRRHKLAVIGAATAVAVSGVALTTYGASATSKQAACAGYVRAFNDATDDDPELNEDFAVSLQRVVSEAPASLKPNLKSFLQVVRSDRFPESGMYEDRAIRQQCRNYLLP